MTRHRKQWFYFLIGTLNVAVGVMFYVVTIPAPIPAVADVSSFVRHQPALLSSVPATTGIPTRIVIPSLDIDLHVSVGSYSAPEGTWTINPVDAFYADPSMPVNNSNGRTLIYGHAQSQVFGRLPTIQDGAEVMIYTDTAYVFHFRYVSQVAVRPTDTTVFSADGPPTLVLQTCTGDWDAYRSLYSFAYSSKEKV